MAIDYANRAIRDLENIDNLVTHLLLEGGISKPPIPENLISLFDLSRPIYVDSRPLGSLRGVLQPYETHWQIVTNSTLPYGAQRFSLFHEGFHILHRCGVFGCNKDGVYNEWLADHFAARMLMPRRWIIELGQKAKDLKHLCAIFKVSQEAMRRRLRELNIKVEG